MNVSDGGFAAGDVFRRKEYGYKEVPLRKEYGESSGERRPDLEVGQTILTPHRLGWTCLNNYNDASTDSRMLTTTGAGRRRGTELR